MSALFEMGATIGFQHRGYPRGQQYNPRSLKQVSIFTDSLEEKFGLERSFTWTSACHCPTLDKECTTVFYVVSQGVLGDSESDRINRVKQKTKKSLRYSWGAVRCGICF